jgi:hypothetical protein
MPSAAVGQNRTRLLPAARSVLATLRKDPLTLCQQIRLAAIALPFDELAEFIAAASAEHLLHAGATESLVQSIQGAESRSDAKLLETLEKRFSADTDDVLRRVALASLVALSGSNRGWNQGRLRCLHEISTGCFSSGRRSGAIHTPGDELVQADD